MLEAFQRLSLTSTQYYTQISTNQFSQRLLKCSSIKRLDSLKITNFKSFKGKVYIGPLLNFTSIIGPNGAGKSNILDALMFAFCNEKSKVRYFDVREFINRQGLQTYKEMSDKNKYCEVEVQFQLSDNRYLTVTRSLFPNEQQSFLIDGDQYPQKVYENFLMKNNINYITSNYAIWQGQIDKLIMKNPKDLTNYLEIISGSIFFKKDQEEIKEQLQNIEEHMNLNNIKILKLKQQKKMMKTFKHQKKSQLKIESEYELVLKQLVLAKALLSELQLKQFEKSINLKEKEEQKKKKEINETKVLILKEQSEKLELQKKINTLMREIAQNNTQLRNIGQLSNVIDIQNISQLSQEIENLQKYCMNLNYRKELVGKDMNNLPSTDENKQYLDIYRRWQRQNEAINKELSKRKEEYLYTFGILQSKKAMMEQFTLKEMKLNEQSKEQHQQKVEIEKNIEQLENNISKMKVEHSKMVQEYSKSEKTIQNIQQKVIEVNEKIINLETILTDCLQSEKDKDLVLKLKEIEGFKGIIEQWIKPSHQKYNVCFDMIVGSIFKYLLCTDQQSSKQITMKLRENYHIRNLVILSNVKEKKETVNRSSLGKQGVLAIDAIDFDKKLQKFDLFLQQYLNGKVICENLEDAWSLLGKNIRGIKQIYTQDGNCLRQDGIVSSQGSISTSKKKYRYGDISRNNSSLLQEIQSLKKEKIKEEEELEKIKKKSNNEMLSMHSLNMQRLQGKREELKLKLDWLKKSIQNKKESRIPKNLEKDIQELEKKVRNLNQGVNEIEKEMMKSNIFEDFLKRNNIDNLEQFRSVQDLSSLEEVIKAKTKFTKELQQLQRQIEKITSKISQKNQILQHLKEKVDSIKGYSDKNEIQKSLKKKEKQLIQARSELAKVKIFNPDTLKFKSQVAQMAAKLEVMKERHQLLIKNQAQVIGLRQVPSSSEFNLLEEPLGVKIDRASKERVEVLEEELQREKEKLEKQLQKYNIPLTEVRSEHQSEENLDNQISRITQELKEENEMKNELNSKLDKVKQDRKSVFMNYLKNQLQPILTEAYHMLTEKDNKFGRVDIFMENEVFPCDSGLYYAPVPPTKRYVYDLDQLSGGQKSIASLALQYSIALASKSPFLILDETDAFLDSENTRKFISLVRKTLAERNLQFIIITHKRSLFLSGESLVGVTKFKDDPFSKAFSLRLNDPNEPDQKEAEFQ